ncbi:MAG: FecR family protein [Exilibacterium sp.]
MNNDFDKGSGDQAAEDTLNRLLSHAGERQKAPTALKARVRQQVYSAWKQQQQSKDERHPAASTTAAPATRNWGWLLAAASLMVGIGLIFSITVLKDASETPVATVTKVLGNAWYISGQENAPDGNAPDEVDWQPLTVGRALPAHSRLRTLAEARVALALGETSVRVDERTDVVLSSGETLALTRGQLYMDTGTHASAHKPALTVITAHGRARDIGTQFLVHALPDLLAVAVREGSVDIHRVDTTIHTRAGERVSVNETGTVTRELVSTDASAWNWAIALAPSFEIENAKLKDFLVWVSRELGKPLIFASPLVQQECELTVLHGNIDNLSLYEALTTVLETTRFRLDTNSSETITIVEG